MGAEKLRANGGTKPGPQDSQDALNNIVVNITYTIANGRAQEQRPVEDRKTIPTLCDTVRDHNHRTGHLDRNCELKSIAGQKNDD